MNVAVKALNRAEVISQDEPLVIVGSKQLMILLMGLLILISAFSVVFVRDMNRQMVSQLQILENTQNNLHNEWSQLLLEEGTWASQARVGELATQELNMVVPKTKSTIILEE